MSKTAQALEKLPQNIRDHIENIKKTCQDKKLRHDHRIAGASYVLALQHMGLVSEVERRLLLTYMTLE